MILTPIYLNLFCYHGFQGLLGAPHELQKNFKALKLSNLIHYGCLKMNALTPDCEF